MYFSLFAAQLTLSAAGTVSVSHTLLVVRSSCLLRGRRASFQNGMQQEKAFYLLRFKMFSSVIAVQCELLTRIKKDAPHKNNVFYLNSAQISELLELRIQVNGKCNNVVR
jgi:hypothetical protein